VAYSIAVKDMTAPRITTISLLKPIDNKELSTLILPSLQTSGFLAFTNHGLEDISSEMFEISKDYFKNTTIDEKRSYAIEVGEPFNQLPDLC
jgi:hypothetical protein